jgi:hypothetical protein
MKTKIELGNPVKSIEHTSGSMLDIIWLLVVRSTNESDRDSVYISVMDSINNSLRWEIEL